MRLTFFPFCVRVFGDCPHFFSSKTKTNFDAPEPFYPQVGAIRVDEKGRQARLLEACIFERRCSSGNSCNSPNAVGTLMTSIGGEEVFLHQLLQIARLLDAPFQASWSIPIAHLCMIKILHMTRI